MNRIKNNIDTGHIITIAIFLFAIIGSGITTYYTIKFTAQNNTIQIQKLNRKVQETNNKLGDMDKKYVRQKAFDEYKNNTNSKLDNIADNVNYLIRLQIDKSAKR